jgi:hypothetical protein
MLMYSHTMLLTLYYAAVLTYYAAHTVLCFSRTCCILYRYFNSTWNCFDFCIVVVSLVPIKNRALMPILR